MLTVLAAVGLAGVSLTASGTAQTLTAPTLSIYAGSGQSAASIPGAATLSPMNLNLPASGVAIDQGGDLYVADTLNNMVERVVPASAPTYDAILSVVAGTGTAGAATAGQAIDSDLRDPSGVALDASGNLFIADYLNHTVEKVTPAGQLSVIAGTGVAGAATPGAATDSALGLPVGVAVDQSTGDLYIADSGASAGGNVVEKVTPAGLLSVVAGTGTSAAPTPGPATSSAVGDPAAVAVDASGNLYIADSADGMVVEVSGGNLSIVAGTGSSAPPIPGPASASPLGVPAGLAVDVAGSLYIADSSNDVVEKIAGGNLSIVAGVTAAFGSPTSGPATASDLNGPVGVAVDSIGNLYVSDVGSNVVEKITFPTPPPVEIPPVIPPPVVPPPVVPPPVVPPPVVALPPAFALPKPSVLIASGPVTVNAGLLINLPSTAPSGAKAVAASQTPSGQGTWVIAADGGVFTTGDAGFYGSTGGLRLAQPIEGMAPTADGKGYWLVASDGGIFTFGDAGFYGSLGNIRLNKPIVGMAATASGRGYWLFAADGGIFTFGDAGFYGSTGAVTLARPINGMSSTQSGHGYWLVASDGGIFTFGDAGFYGSLGAVALSAPVRGMVTSDGGHGYWLVGGDGRVYDFGDAA